MPRNVLALLFTIASIGLVGSGCGSGEDPGVKVTGSVTMGGANQVGVAVGFIPLDPKLTGTSKAAATDANGKFEIMLKPGKYSVILNKRVDSTGNVPGPEVDVGQLPEGEIRDAMPALYTNPTTTPLSAEIPAEGKDLPPFVVEAS